MYLLNLYFKHALKKGAITFDFSKEPGKIKKWTFLAADSTPIGLLQLIALVCGGVRFFDQLRFDNQELFKHSHLPIRVESILALHSHDSCSRSVMGSGLLIACEGKIKILKNKDCQFLSSENYCYTPRIERGNSSYFTLGYGHELVAHNETDDFTFTDPYFRLRRFLSLFTAKARITDPVAFLAHIHYRGIQRLRIPPKHSMERLGRLFKLS